MIMNQSPGTAAGIGDLLLSHAELGKAEDLIEAGLGQQLETSARTRAPYPGYVEPSDEQLPPDQPEA